MRRLYLRSLQTYHFQTYYSILLNKYYGALSSSVDGYSLTSPYQNLGEKIKESMLPKAEQSEQYAYKTQ